MTANIGNIHKILLASALIVIAAQIAVYVYVLRPEQHGVDKAAGMLNSSKSDLRKNNWPANIGILNSIKNEYKAKLEGDDEEEKSISMLYDMAMKRAGATFSKKIEKEYSGLMEFRRNASRLDYQAEHSRVFSDVAKRGFVLDPSSVGLDLEAPSPYIYQLMLQLWTMEKLLNLAAGAGLTLQAPETQPRQAKGRRMQSNSNEVQQSSVYVQPMKAYMVKDRTMPYLAEFPVALKLKGNLNSLMDFLNKLQGDELFLPVSAFEIFAVPPAKIAGGADGELVSGTMHFNLVCSSFLPLPK